MKEKPATTQTARLQRSIEIWGGVECTVNRVRNRYLNQMARSGHLARVTDLDLFAGLGIRALRYPILWEQFAPDGFDRIDWSWADERLGRLRELGVRPIVGLVHHGSGPRHTRLDDPSFATGLAQFARLVAERYPWIDAYTPVNEPLTTARFSALYGLWYPHGRSIQRFARALHVQCRAVALAMQAVREVNPAAELIQTEDLGRVYATPRLAYQAEHENERRWLSFDLLCGRVNSDHPLWNDLLRWGLTPAELAEHAEHPCPPDVIGINHYLSSDRYLDENVSRYPELSPGGNGRDVYVDVEAVRVCTDCTFGLAPRLREAWLRYGLPVAITEAHLGCTREEQMRWLYEAWLSAQTLCDAGADVRAVTVWSLLGAYDWNRLVTRDAGHYESGVFDVRGPRPRPTALAGLVRTIACGQPPTHPVLAQPGWWHRDDRFFYPSAEGRSYAAPSGPGSQNMRDRPAERPLAIVGVTGTLGRAFARLCDVRGIPYHALSRQEVDITDARSVDAALKRFDPWAVVNCAGYVRVDDAERDEQACWRANVTGPAALAAGCARHGAQLVTFSSDLVFDGRKGEPYLESDAPAPACVYGRSKAEMEARVLEILPAALVVRTSAFFGPWDEYNFVTIALRELGAGQTVVASRDAVVSPTYVLDLVHASLDLLVDGEHGIWHLANRGALDWASLARRAARIAGVTTGRVVAGAHGHPGRIGSSAGRTVLASERGQRLPTLDDALQRYMRHRALEIQARAPDGTERRRSFRPWRYQQTGAWA